MARHKPKPPKGAKRGRPPGTTTRSDALEADVRRAMQRHRVTVAEIAVHLGCSQANVYDQLRGGTTPYAHARLIGAIEAIAADDKGDDPQ